MNCPDAMTMERAYRVLNVPPESSALAIKQAYRKLLKRWHPDLQKSGTTAQAESTEMTRRINEAYALIEHAPLRYKSSVTAKNNLSHSSHAADSAWQDFFFKEALRADTNTPPRMDRVEFWVRFVCGAILGCAVAFAVSLEALAISDPLSRNSNLDGIIVATLFLIVIAFGYGSARLGDRFWYLFFRWLRWFY